jgi:hypothetical protein
VCVWGWGLGGWEQVSSLAATAPSSELRPSRARLACRSIGDGPAWFKSGRLAGPGCARSVGPKSLSLFTASSKDWGIQEKAVLEGEQDDGARGCEGNVEREKPAGAALEAIPRRRSG